MKQLSRFLLGIAAWLLLTASAFASANVTCLIDDTNLNFELEAIAGRSGPINQVQVGSIAIKPAAAKLAVPDITFDRSHIVQQWSLGGDFRLQVEVSDSTLQQNVNVVIFARLNTNTDKYAGRYVLKIWRDGKISEFKGRIKECEIG